MQKTNIGWTEYSWNPMCGCPLPLASKGCSACWARKLHNMRHEAYKRGAKLPVQYAKPFEVIQLFPDRLDDPLDKRKSCTIAVGLMGDLFNGVPFEFIDKVFDTMLSCRQHTFQLLTKWPERALEYYSEVQSDSNIIGEPAMIDHIDANHVHLGVSICTPEEKGKIDVLRQIPAAVKFLSFEPLLADMGVLDLSGINFCIVGCESMPGGRAGRFQDGFNVALAHITDQCYAAGVPWFTKQWPEKGKVVKSKLQFRYQERL